MNVSIRLLQRMMAWALIRMMVWALIRMTVWALIRMMVWALIWMMVSALIRMTKEASYMQYSKDQETQRMLIYTSSTLSSL